MRRLGNTFSAVLSTLMPTPMFIVDLHGVGADSPLMSELGHSRETPQSLVDWAFQELRSLESGYRSQLQPLLPEPEISFSVLDAEIAAFIGDGIREQVRVQGLIDNIGREPILEDTPATFGVPQSADTEGFFPPALEGELGLLNQLTVLELPEEKSVSELPMDLVELAQDLAPVPIQSVVDHNLEPPKLPEGLL